MTLVAKRYGLENQRLSQRLKSFGMKSIFFIKSNNLEFTKGTVYIISSDSPFINCAMADLQQYDNEWNIYAILL